jgi:O-antigen/teichoic acid export membrane protein
LKNTLRQEPVKNTFIYYAALIINIFIGWLITKINTNYLEISAFGQYAFFLTFITLSQAFFSFGVFESNSRLMALTKDSQENSRLLGASLTLALLFSVIASIIIYITGFFVDSIFEVKIAVLCQQFFFGVGFLVLFAHLSLALRGSGRIKSLSMVTVGPRITYLLLLLLILKYGQLSLQLTLSMLFIGLGLFLSIVYFTQKPSFAELNLKIHTIWDEVKSYGRHIYVSTILAYLLTHIDKFIISYYLDEKSMAYYGLAFAISFPLTHFSTSMATSLFSRFAIDDKLTPKVVYTNFAFVSISVIVFIILREPIVIYLFSSDYLPTIELLPPMALGFGFSGLSKPYTLFLMARKQGKQVRNISIVIPVIQIILCIIIIPVYGILGAAWVACFVYALDYILFVISYNRFIRKQHVSIKE